MSSIDVAPVSLLVTLKRYLPTGKLLVLHNRHFQVSLRRLNSNTRYDLLNITWEIIWNDYKTMTLSEKNLAMFGDKIIPKREYEMLCAILYHLHNFKNVKNTHGGVITLVKLQAWACNFTKRNTLLGCFSRFSNCTDGTK